MNTSHYIALVAEFHRVFQQRHPEEPDFTCAATNELRPKLIAEELHELKAAYDSKDRVEQLDACCDIQYVLSGAIIAWGLRSMFESTKLVTDLKPIRDFDGHIAAMMGLNDQMDIAARLHFPAQVLTFLILLQNRLAKSVHHLGFGERFSQAFDAVHESNMSKLWDTPDYKAPDVYQMKSTHGGKWIAYRGDGKILKPATFKKPELGRFVKP